MTLYNLAKKIASFVWRYGDWYEISDIYETEGELVTETYLALCRGEGKEIADFLKETYYDLAKENDNDAEEARQLYVELTQGGRMYA